MDCSKKKKLGRASGGSGGVCASSPGAVLVERHKAKTPVVAP